MKKVSVLFPTRNRYDMFISSTKSLIEQCHSCDNIEILLAVDDDDTETTNKIAKFIKDKSYIKMYYYERKRYRGLHHYINDLAQKACDGSLLLWNDDAIMTSKNWDLEILKLHENFLAINPKVENMEDYWKNTGVLFPVIPKKWIDITKIWSPTPGLDSWIDVLSKKLNILHSVDTISILHDRFELTGNNDDETYIEGRVDKTTPSLQLGYEVWSYPELLEEHYNKLLDYINNK
jgi:hypothetical protein